MEVAQNHNVPRVLRAGGAGAGKHTCLRRSARKQAPGNAWRDVAGNGDVDCEGQPLIARPKEGRGSLITQHGLPIACGEVDRGLGPAGESGANLRDHAAKSLVVLNGPVGLKRSL